MNDIDQRLVLLQKEAIELLAYLLTSAQGLMNEPQDYGPLRLLGASERLSGFMLPRASETLTPLLKTYVEEIPNWIFLRQRDPHGYEAFISECCKDIAQVLNQREASEVDLE